MNELKLQYHFGADPNTVFAYISQPDYLLKWWGPESITIEAHALDFTRLGPWSSVMTNAEGQKFKVTGEVTLVDAPKAIELTWAWHDENDKRGHNSIVRFELESDGKGGTIFTLLHSGLADETIAENHNIGWTSSLKKLERIAK